MRKDGEGDKGRRFDPRNALRGAAAAAMELGFDAILLNTAVARAGDPVAMARAMAQAVEAGRAAHGADPMEPREMAVPSTPVIGKAFLA